LLKLFYFFFLPPDWITQSKDMNPLLSNKLILYKKKTFLIDTRVD
jgi:hypothetical protein